MPVLYKRGLLESTRVTMLSPDCISPNPDQPRRYFDPQGLAELADSIRVHGILQPLTVRRKGGGRYELIAGERRLRAAMICGLAEVPRLIMDVDRENSCLLSLIENLQRRDLDFWEEAKALERLIRVYGLSQEEAAAKVGKSQSAVANKLRLLRLPDQALELLRKNGFTERHARALLRLPHPEAQVEGAQLVVKEGWTVSRTEQYVEEGDTILLTIRIPKARTPKGPGE
ncbi:MAG: ParB/RepB/Spo0J family partition protein [Evtepia sp.]|uniref:ParB/RepB/Spo0J family partition protein n=1 Tax=Evtepia sp. TaxID=2773933 RepID=UPI002A75194E|nr:ParB/RepB/Spo0J family partition protein [Evtepia sp.]MDY3014331.1 ParB/RepB/Spo0J family partition protein [Evtepia sp.]